MRAMGKELRGTLVLAVPIILGQLGQMLMPLIDSAMIGRLGVVPLASVAFGNMVVWIPMIVGFGLCVAVHVLAASAHGAGRSGEAGEVLRHGLGLAAIYGLLCGVGMQFGVNALDHLPHIEPAVIAGAKPYMLWMGWSILPMLLFTVVKNYAESLNRPWLPMAVLGGCLVLNVFFNCLFIYGYLGAPQLGVAGAALSTLLARALGFVVLLALVFRTPALRPSWPMGIVAGWSGALAWRMLALGVPSGVQILFEVGLFNFTTLLAAMISTITLDAHQITLNICSIAYMVPLGLSMATGIRVSRALGGGRTAEARRIGWSSFAGALGFMALYALLVLLTRSWLPEIFLRPDAPDAPAVLTLATTLLAWAASFAIFDGMQITLLGALRGMHDVHVPTAILFAGYWAVSAPLAWYFGLVRGWGGPGVWMGLLAGLIVVAGLLIARFAVRSRKAA